MSYKLGGITLACTPVMPTNNTDTAQQHRAKMKGGLKLRGRLCVCVEWWWPMCLGALERFHAPISSETHRPRHTHTHAHTHRQTDTHTNTLLGILSTQLPRQMKKSMARGERQKNKDTQREKSATTCIH